MFVSDFGSFDLDTLCRAIGLLGFGIYVTGFFCLCTGRIDSRRPAYFVLVLLASSCVMVSLSVDFNLSAALIQCFYIAMSLGAVALRARTWRMTGKIAAQPATQL